MPGKKIFLMTILSLFILQGFALANEYGDKSKATVIWKTATLAPKGIGYSMLFEEILLPAITEHTNGELYLKIYWGGVMGDDRQVLKKMRVGQLQGAGLSGQGTFMMNPDIPVLGLPFIFNSYDEVDYVKTKMIDTFDKVAMTSGYKLLLWLDQDFDQIYTTDIPVAGLQDFPKVKFLTWFGALEGNVLAKLGANPVLIDVSEMPSAIRAGAANGIIAPSIWVVGTQLYSRLRYVNATHIRYVPAFVVVTEKAWQDVPRDSIGKLASMRLDMAKKFCDRSREESAKCLNAMITYGVRKVVSTPAQIKEIRKKVAPIWKELAGPLYSKAILDELLGNLKDYRAKTAE